MIFKQGSSVFAIGNLTRDPEQRESKSGKTAPVKAAIAVGEKDDVRFVNIIAWYGRGEKLLEAHKGDKIMIGGVEKRSTYYSEKAGEDVEKVEIDCECVFVVERRGGASKPPQKPSEPLPDMEETEEDLPF
jgi:single-stranded DNA-binding protein